MTTRATVGAEPPDGITCVLLAGGRGTRIASVAGDCPKHLLPVAGQPFAALQLGWLERQGVERVVYCLGNGADMIESYVRERGPASIAFDFVRDGAFLLGTGGALRRAYDLGAFGGDVLVLYGDTLLSIDLAGLWAAHRASGLAATMAVFRNDGLFDTSNAEFDGRLVRYDKHEPTPAMRWIDYGVSMLSPSALARVPAGEVFDLADLYRCLASEDQLGGYEATERFFEIGTPSALLELESHLRSEAGPKAKGVARAN